MYPTKKLWEICKVIKWKNPELFLEVWEWKIPYLTAKFIRWLQLPSFALVSDKKSTLVDKKDIVIICDWSNSGETFIGLEWILSSTMWKLSFNQEINTLFINHFLVLIIKELKTRRFWAAIPHLDIKWLLSYKIPLPPLPTQKLIVQKLDSSFENINKQIDLVKKNLSRLEELNKSILEKVFSEWDYEEVVFWKICDFVRWPFWWSLKKEIFKKSWYVVYEQMHAIWDQYEEIRYYIDEQKFNEMKRFELRSWNLIMSCSGTMWKVSIVPEWIKKWIINQALLVLKPNEKLLNKYLKLYMESWVFQDEISKYSKWAAIKNVASVKILKEIQIPLPPLQKQKEIVTYLDEVFEKNKQLKTKYDEQLKELEELKQSLLKDAFDGRLIL
jgi:restriction endonuclease S subunit